mgnify:CR=1 FL=1
MKKIIFPATRGCLSIASLLTGLCLGLLPISYTYAAPGSNPGSSPAGGTGVAPVTASPTPDPQPVNGQPAAPPIRGELAQIPQRFVTGLLDCRALLDSGEPEKIRQAASALLTLRQKLGSKPYYQIDTLLVTLAIKDKRPDLIDYFTKGYPLPGRVSGRNPATPPLPTPGAGEGRGEGAIKQPPAPGTAPTPAPGTGTGTGTGTTPITGQGIPSIDKILTPYYFELAEIYRAHAETLYQRRDYQSLITLCDWIIRHEEGQTTSGSIGGTGVSPVPGTPSPTPSGATSGNTSGNTSGGGVLPGRPTLAHAAELTGRSFLMLQDYDQSRYAYQYAQRYATNYLKDYQRQYADLFENIRLGLRQLDIIRYGAACIRFREAEEIRLATAGFTSPAKPTFTERGSSGTPSGTPSGGGATSGGLPAPLPGAGGGAGASPRRSPSISMSLTAGPKPPTPKRPAFIIASPCSNKTKSPKPNDP